MKITLCGSARFESHFHTWNEILSLSGHLVYGMSVYPSFKRGKKDWYTKQEKQILDDIHFAKIKESNAILVLNVMAYIGSSTFNEIEYAFSKKKQVYALESWCQGKGIGPMHNEEYRMKAQELKVYGIGSPIDTFYPHMKEVWDLLPEAGGFRSGLVERHNQHEAYFRRSTYVRRD